jgi:hypothetical protein
MPKDYEAKLMNNEKDLKNPTATLDEGIGFSNDSTDIAVDDYKGLELELVKSTRDNFLVWKDYEY